MATVASAKKKAADAKLFWNGRSQAVRLPKEFRFEGDRVRVIPHGRGHFARACAGDKEGNG